MLRIGNKAYPLCLLDTCAVSEMAKDPKQYFANFKQWSERTDPITLPALSVFTFIELRRRPDLFAQFVEVFKDQPAVILKGMDQFLDEEMAHYPDPSGIDPVLLALTPFGDEGSQIRNLPSFLDQHQHLIDGWEAAVDPVLDGITSLVTNYLPEGSSYTKTELDTFLLIVVTQHLGMYNMDFARGILGTGEAIDLDAFPSVKALAYAVFYKFYNDRKRRALRSDTFDLLISTALPYVEAVVTEANLAEALSQVRRQGSFLQGLEVRTLRDLRNPPTAHGSGQP